MTQWNIACDFDGTVSLEDAIDSLLERFGRAGWQRLERDWRDGLIGSRDCMAGQVALLDMDSAQFADHLSRLHIDPAFARFVGLADAAGVPLRIVSDGMDEAIRSLLAPHRLDHLPIAANHLRQTADRSWVLDFPFAQPACRSGTCKCACVGSVRNSPGKTLLIGDGASDFCVAGRVDFVFAKHRLIAHCEAHRIAHIAISGFEDAIALLPRLLAGEFDERVDQNALAIA